MTSSMDHEESLRRLREAVGGEFSANSPPVIPAGTMDQEPIGSAIAHLASEFMGLGQADRSPEWQRVVAMRAEGNNSPSSDKAWRDWEVVSPTRCASPRLPTTSDTTAKWSGNFNEAGSAAAEIAPGVQHVDSEQGVIAVVSSPPAPQPSASSSAANTVCSGQEQAAPLAAKAIPADSAAQDISEPIMAASQHDTGPAKPEQLLDVSDAAQPEDQVEQDHGTDTPQMEPMQQSCNAPQHEAIRQALKEALSHDVTQNVVAEPATLQPVQPASTYEDLGQEQGDVTPIPSPQRSIRQSFEHVGSLGSFQNSNRSSFDQISAVGSDHGFAPASLDAASVKLSPTQGLEGWSSDEDYSQPPACDSPLGSHAASVACYAGNSPARSASTMSDTDLAESLEEFIMASRQATPDMGVCSIVTGYPVGSPQHTLEPQHTLGPPVSSSPVPAFPALDSLRSTAGSGVMVGDFEASDEDAVELLHADLEGPDGGSEVEAPPVAAPPVNDAPASGPAPPAARPPAYGRLPSLVVEQVLAGLRVPLDKVSSSEMVQRFWSWLQEWTGRLQAVLPTRPILHLYHLAPMKGQPQRIDWVKAGLATSVVALGALVGYLALRQRDLTRALRLKDKEISQMVFRMFSLQEALQGSRRIPIIRHTCSFTSFNAADLI